MLLGDARSYYKAFKEENKPTKCLWLTLLLSEVNHPILRAEAFSGGFPRGQRKWEDECAARCLLSPGFIKLGFNAFSFLLIKLLGQWLMIPRLSETSREWRWAHEQKGWAWISNRDSGLSHCAGWDFSCFPPRALCVLPWLLSRLTSQPTDPLPHGLQVDPGGRESHRSRISSCLSVSNPSLVLL